MTVQFTGIDPGLVDTGIVGLRIDTLSRTWSRYIRVVPGPGNQVRPQSVQLAAAEVAHTIRNWPGKKVIEAYKPRSHFNTDAKMGELVTLIHRGVFDSEILLNTGVKKVVTPHMLRLFKLWDFPGMATHHQDLRSAARIGIYGALKDEYLNSILYQFITEQLESGNTAWREI